MSYGDEYVHELGDAATIAAAEAEVQRARAVCDSIEHDYRVVADQMSNEPRSVCCYRCGESWRVEQ